MTKDMLGIDLTADEVFTQRQILLISGMAIETLDNESLQSLLNKFNQADALLPLLRPSEWLQIRESAPLHLELIKTFIRFRDAAVKLHDAANK